MKKKNKTLVKFKRCEYGLITKFPMSHDVTSIEREIFVNYFRFSLAFHNGEAEA